MRGWQWVTGLSLTHGPLHVALGAGTLLGLVVLLALGRGRRWWRHRVPLGVVIAAGLLTGITLTLDVVRPWPDPLPVPVLAWIGAGLLALVLAILGWRQRRWRGRVLGAAAALLVVVGAADGVDTVFGAFPTLATALQLAPAGLISAQSALVDPGPTTTAPVPGRALSQVWRPPPGLRPDGAVMQVDIPATRSGFTARPAWVYLPPAYFAADRPLLPVLMLLGGQPGGPRDWLDGGQLQRRMDAWAQAHNGLAPVVVMPDALGSPLTNPMCLDSALGHVDTYLTRDVTAWVTSALQVDPDHAHWAVGGFSSGGTCALQLAVAHPDVFPTFFDASGQQGPTLGDRARTVAAAFHGDDAAYNAVDPLRELAARRYPGSAAYLVVGEQDRRYLPQALQVAGAARAAGMSVTLTELPGRHEWKVWGTGFDRALPWLASRTGLTP